MGLGVGFGQLQLNNSLTVVIFDILHLPGKISKYDPLEKFDPPLNIFLKFLPWYSLSGNFD